MKTFLQLSCHPFRSPAKNEGFVLVLSMIMLLILSLLGVWSITNATHEVIISGNEQQYEKRFNLAEGGANIESGYLGYNVRSEYAISNPGLFNQILHSDSNNIDDNDTSTWPTDNITDDTTDDELEYGYLVTYIGPDIVELPKGYGSEEFSCYSFRINGEDRIVVEQGGLKIGDKFSL